MAFKRGGEDKLLILGMAAVIVLGIVTFNTGEPDGDVVTQTSQAEAEPTNTEPEQVMAVDQSSGVLITREEYGERWPFTADEGRIECRRGGALIFIVRDFEYQLNGLAQQMGYTKINSIWRWNPDIPGTRISLTPIIQRAKSFC